MKKKLPYLLPSIVFFICAPLIWFVCFREVPLKISEKTTYLTQPLIQDGKSIDYFQAIKDRFEPKCKPEENGFRMIVQALGKSPFFEQPDWYWPELCKELELDPNLEPTLKYEPPGQFLNREYLLWLDKNEPIEFAETPQQQSDQLTDTEKLDRRLQTEPWTAEEFPFMVRWVEENSPLLDLVAEAMRKEYFYQPRSHSLIRCDFYVFGEGFRYRSAFRLGNGDIDGAWSDAMNFCRISIFTGRAIFNPVNRCFSKTHHLFENIDISEDRQAKFRDDLDRLPPLLAFSEAIWGNRIAYLASVAHFYKSGNPINWNTVARKINSTFDTLEDVANRLEAIPDSSERTQIIQKTREKVTVTPQRSWLSNMLGKPITVGERSMELASVSQVAASEYFLMLFSMMNLSETDLAELRKMLEETKEPGMER